jgi:hypothetical protein
MLLDPARLYESQEEGTSRAGVRRRARAKEKMAEKDGSGGDGIEKVFSRFSQSNARRTQTAAVSFRFGSTDSASNGRRDGLHVPWG